MTKVLDSRKLEFEQQISNKLILDLNRLHAVSWRLDHGGALAATPPTVHFQLISHSRLVLFAVLPFQASELF